MANALLIFRSGSTISDALCLAKNTASDICRFFNYIFFHILNPTSCIKEKRSRFKHYTFKIKNTFPFQEGHHSLQEKIPWTTLMIVTNATRDTDTLFHDSVLFHREREWETAICHLKA